MGPSRIVNEILKPLGIRITRTERREAIPDTPFSPLSPGQITDLDRLSAMAGTIPGMIAPRSGEILYTLCLFQQAAGDVVEIGSWQGRSTSYLALATRQSGNGQFHAIDHFKGNVGKESAYAVGSKDLSDLRDNFLGNMAKMGLSDAVHLHDMSNDRAAVELAGTPIRFLFIDGDHTPEGVRKDVELFFPLLVPGAIVAFDDYQPRFNGVVEAANEYLGKSVVAMTYRNTAILRVENVAKN